MVNKNILMLIRTSGLEYDDRVRKEILTLNRIGYTVEILANYTSNKPEFGMTSYGTNYHVFKLYTRLFLPSARFLPIKMFEFWFRVRLYTLFKKYDYVWLHEEYMFLNALIKPVKSDYILDLHELPNFVFGNDKRLKLYRAIEKNVIKIVVANSERLIYMKNMGLVQSPEKYVILNNYPDKIFAGIKKSYLPENITEFLAGGDYVLLQGGGHRSRYPDRILQAIKKHNIFKVIIVGPVDSEIDHLIETQYKGMVYRTGYIEQLQIPKYFDHAKFTIITYNSDDPNSLYCEPNRLYQSILRELPVIVGLNPPMAKVVDAEMIGVVLQSDGRDSDDIYQALLRMDAQYDIFKYNVRKISKKFLWEKQENVINRILS